MFGLRRNSPRFAVEFGNERNRSALSDDVRPVRNSDPPLVTPLGAEFVITARRDEAIDIDVRRNVPAQPFAVIRTVTYY